MTQQPQLRMRLEDVSTLSQPDPPAGAHVRRATDDDAVGLARCLSLAFTDSWDVVRVRSALLDAPEVVSTWVVEAEGEIVATASLAHDANHPDAGVLHWVAALPSHAGQGLGSMVSVAALRTCADIGKRAAVLLTDDRRLAAIRTYRRLGFMPLHTDPSHAERWRTIMAALP